MAFVLGPDFVAPQVCDIAASAYSRKRRLAPERAAVSPPGAVAVANRMLPRVDLGAIERPGLGCQVTVHDGD